MFETLKAISRLAIGPIRRKSLETATAAGAGARRGRGDRAGSRRAGCGCGRSRRSARHHTPGRRGQVTRGRPATQQAGAGAERGQPPLELVGDVPTGKWSSPRRRRGKTGYGR